jgi:3-phenylpropionate/cinnamic acid dioxygenase small subunit
MRDPRYVDFVEFLYYEAAILDDFRLEEWKQLLAEDLTYCMPVRVTRFRDEGSEFADRMGHFDDTYLSIALRIDRLVAAKDLVWAENPASRSRRFVSNIMVFATDRDGEYEVHSSILLLRYAGDQVTPTHLSAARHDIIRRTGKALKLARREIYVDQTRLATANLGVFL